MNLNEVLGRIRKLQPEPAVLTDDELALVTSWLQTCGLTYRQRLTAWKERIRGLPTPDFDAEVQWHRHLKFVVKYNTRLRTMPSQQAADDPSPAGDETNRLLKLWNQLTDRQRDCMRVLQREGAVSADTRRTTEQLSYLVLGRGGRPESLKSPLADLAMYGVLESRSGRGGGYWLSERGRALLAAVDCGPGPGEATARPAAG